MLIDTIHKRGGTSVVVTPTTEREHRLSDDAWCWVARNQHRLSWTDASSSRATLPKRVPAWISDRSARVERSVDRVTIELPAA